VRYKVEFDGETYTTTENFYPVRADERGRIYAWSVTAVTIDKIEKEATSDIFVFTTRENRPPRTPHGPVPAESWKVLETH
ncbi:hypothetical protein, partial [Klebsiella quasipneumoniae]|uniref:hypothetical protein n=1 Tax=Klebsiella quasipneumoniae TaxID=1463165 RepID=UPI0027313A59